MNKPPLGVIQKEKQGGAPFNFKGYLTLEDTGRIQRGDKCGWISESQLSILERLNIDTEEWLENTHKLKRLYNQKLYYKRPSFNTA